MSKRTTLAALFSLCLIMASIVSCGRGTTPSTPPGDAQTGSRNRAQQPAATPPAAQPSRTAPATEQPTATEINQAIKRIFDDAVTVDEARAEPFVVGDFNGDRSPDIAIVIRPVKSKLALLNDAFANWIIEDPHTIPQMDEQTPVQTSRKKPAPQKIRPDDVLLAIIHGYEETGWRNPAARQTYLLRNAVGTEMAVQPVHVALRSASAGEKMPGLRGDVIRETFGGKRGFVYWTGAKYSWHTPQTKGG